MPHFNANLHSLSFCPCHSALFMLLLSSRCPTIKQSRHKHQTPCHNTNIILLFTSTACRMGSAVLPFVTQASDSSKEEEGPTTTTTQHQPTLKPQHHPQPHTLHHFPKFLRSPSSTLGSLALNSCH